MQFDAISAGRPRGLVVGIILMKLYHDSLKAKDAIAVAIYHRGFPGIDHVLGSSLDVLWPRGGI